MSAVVDEGGGRAQFVRRAGISWITLTWFRFSSDRTRHPPSSAEAAGAAGRCPQLDPQPTLGVLGPVESLPPRGAGKRLTGPRRPRQRRGGPPWRQAWPSAALGGRRGGSPGRGAARPEGERRAGMAPERWPPPREARLGGDAPVLPDGLPVRSRRAAGAAARVSCPATGTLGRF
jgi:hypothetical protein